MSKYESKDIPKNIENLLKLAGIAEEGNNYDQAYEFYSRVLEIDAEYSFAWLAKGVNAAFISSGSYEKFKEAMVCINEAFRLNPDDLSNKEYAAVNIVIGLNNYLINVFNKFGDDLEGYTKAYTIRRQTIVINGSLAESIGAGLGSGISNVLSENATWNSRRDTLSGVFDNKISNLVLVVLNYAWNLSKTKNVSSKIYKVVTLIYGTGLLNYSTKEIFQNKVTRLLRTIDASQVTMRISPQLGEEKRDPIDSAVHTTGRVLKYTLIVIAIIIVVFCCYITIAVNSNH